jgi:hypothetical protein
MLQRLDYDQEDKKPEQVRKEFDGEMQIKRWKITDAVEEPEAEVSEIEKKAPYWWDGEEEASNSFLTAMGIQLDK